MTHKAIGMFVATVVLLAGSAAAFDLPPTVVELEGQKLRYEYATAGFALADNEGNETEFTAKNAAAEASELKYKSPMKAFLMSMAIPGLGQYYYGSRIKPLAFVGVEITAWVFYLKFSSDADDLTAAYEAYNRAHWSKSDYQDKYLQWTYGVNDDHLVPNEYKEISHHLPLTKTQQYFEMTGKYDQFVWGWDDAVLSDGRTLDSFSEAIPPPRVIGNDVPVSVNRDTYETMRDDANNKYGDADKMVIVALVNRVVSAFEAYFFTRHQNSKIRQGNSDFGRIDVRAKLKSCYTKRDTPFLQLTLKF